jgi:O-antigen ligase
LELIVYIVILIVTGTVPFIFAAVQPWVWSFYVAVIFAGFIYVMWAGGISFKLTGHKIFVFSVGFFFLYTLFQCIPLPNEILKALSPYRHALLQKSSLLTGIPMSWQPVSYSSMNSLSWWIFLLSLVLYFSILERFLISHRNIKRLVFIIFVVGVIEAVYGLMQALIPSVGLVLHYSSCSECARGTYVCRNHFAGFLEMVWPLGLAYAMTYGNWEEMSKDDTYSRKKVFKDMLSSDRVFRQFFIALFVVLMVLALVFSRSRAGIAGAAVGLIAFILILRSANRGLPIVFSMIVGVVVILFFMYGYKIGFGPILERFLELGEGISRIGVWQDSLAIAKDHPLGIGLGNFYRILPAYAASNMTENIVRAHAHNDYLQLLIEAGLPGFIFLVGGFIIFLWSGIRRLVRLSLYQEPLRFFVATGALSGLISMAFHSFFDFNLQMPANCIYFVTLVSLAYACLWKRPKKGILKKKMNVQSR